MNHSGGDLSIKYAIQKLLFNPSLLQALKNVVSDLLSLSAVVDRINDGSVLPPLNGIKPAVKSVNSDGYPVDNQGKSVGHPDVRRKYPAYFC